MGDFIGVIIGFIPIAFSILWGLEVASHEKGFEPGICGCIFCFLAGAGLGGTINSIISGELNTAVLMFFIFCSIVRKIFSLTNKVTAMNGRITVPCSNHKVIINGNNTKTNLSKAANNSLDWRSLAIPVSERDRIIYDPQGNPLALKKSDVLARGGEGVVYNLGINSNYLIKVCKDDTLKNSRKQAAF